MIKKLLIIILVLTLSNCRLFTGASRYNLANMNYKVPDGTPIFQQGYRDGCENGLFSRGNALYRTKYDKYKYTPSLIDNPEYKFGYGRGYGYCFTFNTGGGHSGGVDSFIYGKGIPVDYGKSTIDKTVNYEQGTWNNPLNVKFGGVDGIFKGATSPKGFSVFGSHPLYGSSNNQIFSW